MSLDQKRKSLNKMIAYILGHRPDEFGLVPAEDGSLAIKDLRQALIEEEGWSWVRVSSIEEIPLALNDPTFELLEGRIRAKTAGLRPVSVSYGPAEPPKLLYMCVRRRAYVHVLRKGLRPAKGPHVVLATTEELALRMGRRSDPHPVLLTVQAGRAAGEGIVFLKAGELLYLVDWLPARVLHGPSLEKVAPKRRAAGRVGPEKKAVVPGSGAPARQPSQATLAERVAEFERREVAKRERKKRRIGWKEERRKRRRR